MNKKLSLVLIVLLFVVLVVLAALGLLVDPYEFAVEAGKVVVSKVCLPAAGAIATAVVAVKLLRRNSTADLSGNRWLILAMVSIGLLLATALFRVLADYVLALAQ
jgi:hypothetical protein